MSFTVHNASFHYSALSTTPESILGFVVLIPFGIVILTPFGSHLERLHHRAVDNARLSAKIYSADACLLNCGASSPLRFSVPKNWMFIDASRSPFDL